MEIEQVSLFVLESKEQLTTKIDKNKQTDKNRDFAFIHKIISQGLRKNYKKYINLYQNMIECSHYGID